MRFEKLFFLIAAGGFGGILVYTIFDDLTDIVLLGVIIAFLIDFKLNKNYQKGHNQKDFSDEKDYPGYRD